MTLSPLLLQLIQALAEQSAQEDYLAAQAQRDAVPAEPAPERVLPATNRAA